MNWLIAFDKFKGALSAEEAVDLTSNLVRKSSAGAEIETAPLTDGGEGFATIIAKQLDGDLVEIEVPGPRFQPVKGRFAMVSLDKLPNPALQRLNLPADIGDGRIAFVEMASASGYECLDPEERDPWKTSTIGTGVLMQAAVGAGAKALVLGIGGSATNDCGAGALEALGVLCYDRELQPVTKVTPEGFKAINTVGSTSHLLDTFPPVRIACDVNNPLLGETGATRIFGPQKGLREADTARMERTIAKMAKRILGLFGKAPEAWEELMAEPGSGAAGGIGFALRHALPDSSFVEGFPLVAELLGLQEKTSRADCIITGEGRLDGSSLSGKGPVGLVRMADPSKEMFFLAGSADSVAASHLQEAYPRLRVIPISDPAWPIEKALEETRTTLTATLQSVLKDI